MAAQAFLSVSELPMIFILMIFKNIVIHMRA